MSYVHLWKYDLRDRPRNNSAALPLLSKAEMERVHRLKGEDDRRRFVQARSSLKKVLSRYVHLPPHDIQIVNETGGKPMLKSPHAHPPVYFNQSYRKNYVLIGVSDNSSLGVDVEEVTSVHRLLPFASQFLTETEQKELAVQKTKEDRVSLLFTFWVMKEALIKSMAVGFKIPLTQYELKPFLKQKYCCPSFDPENVWYLTSITLEAGYKAAVAVQAPQVNLKVFNYCREIE
jgi:4'-phosphopantetheinyl transferase